MFRENERRMAETNKALAGLTSKWGRFVEGLLIPAVEHLFEQRGIPVEKVFPRAKARKNGRTLEIDILAVNQEYVVLIEVKSNLSVNDIKEHLQNLSEFKFFYPEYADKKIVGAVAGIVIDEGADRYAYQAGLFVIGQSGETVKILNDKNFVPKTW